MIKRFWKVMKAIGDYMAFYPPAYGTAEDWDDFDEKFRREAPLRFYLRKVRSKLRVRIRWLKEVKWWISYRTTQRYHIVNTKLAPGYHESETVMLHANFSILVDFVEVEQAIQCDENYQKNWLQKLCRSYYRHTFRSRECAEEYFDWAINKCNNHSVAPDGFSQVSAAREIFDLYKWWVDIYLKRTDPVMDNYDIGEERSFMYRASNKFQQAHPERYQYERDWYADQALLQRMYDIEERIMLTRLIAVRKHLWT